MKNEYDFSKMKRVKNPYAKYLKKQITIPLRVIRLKILKKCQEKQALCIRI